MTQTSAPDHAEQIVREVYRLARLWPKPWTVAYLVTEPNDAGWLSNAVIGQDGSVGTFSRVEQGALGPLARMCGAWRADGGLGDDVARLVVGVNPAGNFGIEVLRDGDTRLQDWDLMHTSMKDTFDRARGVLPL